MLFRKVCIFDRCFEYIIKRNRKSVKCDGDIFQSKFLDSTSDGAIPYVFEDRFFDIDVFQPLLGQSNYFVCSMSTIDKRIMDIKNAEKGRFADDIALVVRVEVNSLIFDVFHLDVFEVDVFDGIDVATCGFEANATVIAVEGGVAHVNVANTTRGLAAENNPATTGTDMAAV